MFCLKPEFYTDYINFVGHASFPYDYEGDSICCYCGLKALLVISTSDDNLDKRFFGCSNYKVSF